MRKLLIISLLLASLTTQATKYYLSPTGSDLAAGTIGAPFFTLNKAWTVVAAGDTVYLRGGTYGYLQTQALSGVNGAAGNLIKVWNYPGETPILTEGITFAWGGGFPAAGVRLTANYVHFKGIKITGFVQVTPETLYSGLGLRDCNYCIFEQLEISNCGNGASQTYGIATTGNLWLNCDFHHNYDPYTQFFPTGPTYFYGNADGIGLEANTGDTNTIRGCRAWNNSDDGIDIWKNDGVMILDSNWVWRNGYKEDGLTIGGDGNGLKLGDPLMVNTNLIRTITNNLIYSNHHWGIIDNNAPCLIEIYNNTLSDNGKPAYEGGSIKVDHESVAHFVKNNISYLDNFQPDYGLGTERDNMVYNSWDVGGLDANDFVSVDSTGLSSARQANGGLPLLNFLHLKTGSNMIDAGVDVGITYEGTAPDVGAFEYVSATPPVPPTVTTSAVADITRSTATGVGNVTATGSNPTVVARGVCWSESPNPTVDDAYSNASAGGLGAFTSLITGLSGNTTYYVRAWASNGIVAYGNEVTFTTPISELYRTKDGKLIRDTNGILIRK